LRSTCPKFPEAGQVVMQAAIGDEEHFARDTFLSTTACHVDTRFADEKAPQLDDQLRLRKRALRRLDDASEVGGDGGEIERLLARESRECRSLRRG
jgi:hypothetical protein